MGPETAARFEGFVRANGSGLGRLAFLLTGSRETAEDVVQTALVKAWRSWSTVEHADDPLAYVRRILANACLDESRHRRRRPVQAPIAGDTMTAVDSSASTSAAEDRAELLAMLAGLPARQRTVVVLRYYCDLSEADTADMLGISRGAVKSHASRGLARLRLDVDTEEARDARRT